MSDSPEARLGAVDLGGTKIYSVVSDRECAPLADDYRPTEVERGADAVIGRIAESINAAATAVTTGDRRLAAIGVAAPGPIDVERGLILHAPNLPGWRNVPLGGRLSAIFGCPAVLENDANAAGLGEFLFGAGRGARHMIYLTVSTGIGAGLILDGQLYRGASGAAGELGHVVVDETGPLCGCGRRGCLEVFASGTAIAARAAEAIVAGRPTSIARYAGRNGVAAEHVAQAAADGDPVARAIIGRAAHALGLGLADIVNIFNPDLIVIGGGTAQIGPPLLDPAMETMRANAFAGPVAHVRVVPAALGGRAAAMGALALARALI
ncbi:MAG: ROK family protein [Dehalococcoidia bacterium]